MARSFARFFVPAFALVVSNAALYACSSGSKDSGFGAGDDGGGTHADGSINPGDDAGNNGDVGTLGDGNNGDTGSVMTMDIIYANTDTELYSMDPMTMAVKDIGPFMGVGGGTGDTAVTDLAVNGNNEIWVNTETVIYQAALPAGDAGTGTVVLTKKATIAVGMGQKFYALAFAPAGVLGTGEGLVGGDSNGDLYSIDTTTGTPTKLGGFGNDAMGHPWELSGDLVFYTQNGMALGLATLRSCPLSGNPPKPRCSTTNDYLAQIDMAALTAAYTNHAPGMLLKQVYGTGTGFGDLFGVGAWADKVYGFERAHGGDAGIAQLVSIDGTGHGTSLQTFPNISAGWSGAGVTTKATITVPPPPH